MKNSTYLFLNSSNFGTLLVTLIWPSYCYSGVMATEWPNIIVIKLRFGFYSMGYLEILISYIGSHRMYGRDNTSIRSVTTRVQPLQWFGVLVASYLVYLLINWKTSIHKYCKSDKCFLLFLEVPIKWSWSTKMCLNKIQYTNAMLNHSYYGPTFRRGHKI